MDLASRIWLPDCWKLVINQKDNNDVILCRHGVTVNFIDAIVFLLPSLVSGPSFILMSFLF